MSLEDERVAHAGERHGLVAGDPGALELDGVLLGDVELRSLDADGPVVERDVRRLA